MKIQNNVAQCNENHPPIVPILEFSYQVSSNSDYLLLTFTNVVDNLADIASTSNTIAQDNISIIDSNLQLNHNISSFIQQSLVRSREFGSPLVVNPFIDSTRKANLINFI